MRIGNLELPNKILAAPMAGITDKAFRLLAKEKGCGLVFTEMISAKALTYGNEKTKSLLDLQGEPPPIGVQLFGSEPEVLAVGAKLAEEAGADLIDINMGCPAPKIVKQGEGAALMRTPQLAWQIVEAVAREVSLPVTVKMRVGWSKDEINVVEFAKGCALSGAKAITVHGRTREQYYGGKANWELIGQVVEAVDVPIIGNGDIWTPEDGGRILKETGCAGIMIGRAALGNPWIFSQLVAYLEKGVLLAPPTLEERFETALYHLELVVKNKGEAQGVREMRKQLAWYCKGIPGATRFREKIFTASTVAEVRKIFTI